MNVRLIAEIAGTAMVVGVTGTAIWHWRSTLEKGLGAVLDWSIRTSEFWELAETFLNEAAVLWFVFPVLDDFYDRAKDKPPLTIGEILLSFAVALFAFLMAVYCNKKSGKLKKKTEKGE